MAQISRQEYNNLFGPTVGDKIRLGNTNLYVEIEKDLRVYGDEVVYGGGKQYATAWAPPTPSLLTADHLTS